MIFRCFQFIMHRSRCSCVFRGLCVAKQVTDAPRYDQDWLDRLFDAAGRKQQFTVYHFEVLTHGFSADQHRHLAYLLKCAPPPHRAAPDASRLATKLMEAHLGYPPRTAPMKPTASD